MQATARIFLKKKNCFASISIYAGLAGVMLFTFLPQRFLREKRWLVPKSLVFGLLFLMKIHLLQCLFTGVWTNRASCGKRLLINCRSSEKKQESTNLI